MMSNFSDDDTIYLEAFDDDCNIVCGSPLNSVTGDCKIGMTMVSSFEEAVTAGYKVATDGSNKKLDDKLNQYFKDYNDVCPPSP